VVTLLAIFVPHIAPPLRDWLRPEWWEAQAIEQNFAEMHAAIQAAEAARAAANIKFDEAVDTPGYPDPDKWNRTIDRRQPAQATP